MASSQPGPAARTTEALEVHIGASISIRADVNLPAVAGGVVLFAHGSGSSRHSPRNRQVAEALVIDLNRDAMAAMCCKKELAVVPGATHLFEEAGALDQVAELAGDWFVRFLVQTH